MHRRSRSNRTKDINSYYGDCASLVYSFIPNRRGSPFINFRPICHYPRSLFHNPLILIFGRIATTPVYYINPVNLLLIFHIMSTPLIFIFKQFVQDPLLFHVLPPPPYINFRRFVHYPLIFGTKE